MKNLIKKNVVLLLIISLMVVPTFASSYLPNGATVLNKNNAFVEHSGIGYGANAIIYMLDTKDAVTGKIMENETIKMSGSNSFVSFATAEHTAFEFMPGKIVHYAKNKYWLEIYVNGVLKYVIDEFNNTDYEPYYFHIDVESNSAISIFFKSQDATVEAVKNDAIMFIINPILK